MSPEEKAIRMYLLDCSTEQQEFYRTSMDGILKDLKDKYESIDDEKQKELWLAALSISYLKFVEFL